MEQRNTSMKRWKICLIYILGVFMFYLWYQATVNLLYGGKLLYFEGVIDFLKAIATGYPILLAMFVLNTLIVFYIKVKRDKFARVALDFVLSQAVPFIVNISAIGICLIFGKHLNVLWIQTFVINFMIFMINESLWFVANYRLSRQQYAEARNMATQLEFNVLRSQVNPHFLFNSLNTLYSLTHIDINQAREFVVSLSGLYRYIMNRRDSDTVSLHDELDFLDSYVEVLKILYYDCFEVHITNNAKMEDKLLIPFTLQLLIENVTKHNVINADQPMHVDINISERGITVKNSIIERKKLPDDGEPRGVGLLYLKKLYGYHGKHFKHYIKDNTFTVEIPFL